MLPVSPEWAIAHFFKANTISPTSKKAVSLSGGNSGASQTNARQQCRKTNTTASAFRHRKIVSV